MNGWISRHDKAKTEEIEEVEPLTEWIQKDIPESPLASIVRNDFKLNNLVLNPEDLTEAPAADLCPLGKGPDEERALREL